MGPDGDGRPTIAVGPSGWVVAWRSGNDDLGSAEAWVRFSDADDFALAEVALHEDAPARRPAVDAVGDVAVVAWERVVDEVPEVMLQPWDLATAEPLGEPVAAGVPDGLHHNRPYVALAEVDGAIRGLVTWEGLEVLDPVEGTIHRTISTRAFEVAR